MNPSQVCVDVSRHYERKWRHHDGYWRDTYDPSQRIYAACLYERRNASILAAVPDRVDAVLDIGCGVGDLMFPLSQEAKAVWGVDIAEVNVCQARKNLLRSGVRNATVLQAPAEVLPFQAGSFDVAIMADVIEHIPDTGNALAEIKRVLRPNGVFICVTPHRTCMNLISAADRCLRLPGRALRKLSRIVPLFPQPSKQRRPANPEIFERFLGSSELRAELRCAGFTVESYRRVCFYPGPEGGGAFGWLMSRVHRALGEKRSAGLAQAVVRLFNVIERMGVLNQKQMWIARS